MHAQPLTAEDFRSEIEAVGTIMIPRDRDNGNAQTQDDTRQHIVKELHGL